MRVFDRLFLALVRRFEKWPSLSYDYPIAVEIASVVISFVVVGIAVAAYSLLRLAGVVTTPAGIWIALGPVVPVCWYLVVRFERIEKEWRWQRHVHDDDAAPLDAEAEEA